MDRVYRSYKVARFCYDNRIPVIPTIIRGLMRVIFACDVPYKAVIGKNTVFPHDALGVVIHPNVLIGEECHINQNVTIGGRSGFEEVPKIGNNVLIGANAVIAGPIKIGNNVKVGAGAVVIESIPDNCTVAGVPAKIIKKDGNRSE